MQDYVHKVVTKLLSLGDYILNEIKRRGQHISIIGVGSIWTLNYCAQPYCAQFFCALYFNISHIVTTKYVLQKYGTSRLLEKCDVSPSESNDNLGRYISSYHA